MTVGYSLGNVFVFLFFALTVVVSPILKAADVYFSPSLDCEERIVEAIKNSKKEIVVAVYSINNKKIVDALETAHNNGVNIRVLTDSLQAAGKSSKVLTLVNAGLNLRVHSVNKIMHNKFAVFDSKKAVSGSYNWTLAASNQNSENCILFDEPNVIKTYLGEFDRLWQLNTAEKSAPKLAKISQRKNERTPTGE
jgi:phosphatidylserine/phosphatidylglycerophosphate/cardiolipin synthase-like enzyme